MAIRDQLLTNEIARDAYRGLASDAPGHPWFRTIVDALEAAERRGMNGMDAIRDLLLAIHHEKAAALDAAIREAMTTPRRQIIKAG